MPARPLSELVVHARDPSWVPARKDLATMLPALTGEDARHVERALARAGSAAMTLAIEALPGASAPLRAALCRLLGRFSSEPAAEAALLPTLSDADPRTRRAAASALGRRAPSAHVEARLLAALEAASDDPERKVLVEALGKVGGDAARARLRGLSSGDDRVLVAKLADAGARLLRAGVRGEAAIRTDVAFPPRRVRFSVRRGLGPLLLEELHATQSPGGSLRRDDEVVVESRGPLSALQRPRIALRYGFVTPLARAEGKAKPLSARVVDALLRGEIPTLLQSLTDGPVRYRLEWRGRGHMRAETRDVVASLSTRAPGLVNDPRATSWEIVVEDAELEIWPRGLADPRFAYRVADVPASSHPTIAAALARVAGTRPDDVVWDPFVGAGAELVERARLGPYAALLGCDLDPKALEAARANTGGLAVELTLADARTCVPSRTPTLILTNPPMGRRLREPDGVTRLLSDALENFRKVLSPRGRVVWLCPLFEDGARMAAAFGFRVERRGSVDLGGFSAELQVLWP